MTTRDGRPYDPAVWLHEAQTADDPHDAPTSPPQDSRKQKSEARRQADIKARQTQGDRRDWRLHLLPLGPGYRFAPEDTLSQRQKTARTRSIQKAIEKRKARKGKKRQGRHAFRDPIKEALHYGVRLDPEAVRRDQEARTAGIPRHNYYPDECHPRPYPHEVALDRLCDWTLNALAGSDPVIMSEMAYRDTMRPHEVAAWLWTGEMPEARADIERALAFVSPPPRSEALSLR